MGDGFFDRNAVAAYSPRGPEPRDGAMEARRALAAIEEIGRWADLAQGAYSENTQRAWRADWRVFLQYCARVNSSPLPAARGRGNGAGVFARAASARRSRRRCSAASPA